MDCHYQGCGKKVEDPERTDFYGLCDEHVLVVEKEIEEARRLQAFNK